MALITRLKGKRVCLDTAPVIYFIEEHKTYLPIVEPVFQAITKGEVEAVTSTITLLEVLVMPLKRKEVKLAQRYKEILLHSKGLSTRLLTHDISEKAAELRAKYTIRVPDAIQLATGILKRCAARLL